MYTYQEIEDDVIEDDVMSIIGVAGIDKEYIRGIPYDDLKKSYETNDINKVSKAVEHLNINECDPKHAFMYGMSVAIFMCRRVQAPALEYLKDHIEFARAIRNAVPNAVPEMPE